MGFGHLKITKAIYEVFFSFSNFGVACNKLLPNEIQLKIAESIHQIQFIPWSWASTQIGSFFQSGVVESPQGVYFQGVSPNHVGGLISSDWISRQFFSSQTFKLSSRTRNLERKSSQ